MKIKHFIAVIAKVTVSFWISQRDKFRKNLERNFSLFSTLRVVQSINIAFYIYIYLILVHKKLFKRTKLKKKRFLLSRIMQSTNGI